MHDLETEFRIFNHKSRPSCRTDWFNWDRGSV